MRWTGFCSRPPRFVVAAYYLIVTDRYPSRPQVGAGWHLLQNRGARISTRPSFHRRSSVITFSKKRGTKNQKSRSASPSGASGFPQHPQIVVCYTGHPRGQPSIFSTAWRVSATGAATKADWSIPTWAGCPVVRFSSFCALRNIGFATPRTQSGPFTSILKQPAQTCQELFSASCLDRFNSRVADNRPRESNPRDSLDCQTFPSNSPAGTQLHGLTRAGFHSQEPASAFPIRPTRVAFGLNPGQQ